jgi:GNAT superfamily N-acetyltransferase
MARWRRGGNCRVGADTIIRPGQDADAAAIIGLIAACWGMYPGILMDVDGEMPELRALASYYARAGGALWVAEADSRMVGMIATRPHDGSRGVWEICRVYVDPAHHGGGLGHRLLDLAEAHAMAAGAERLVLWSDTRFDRAHRFYEKRSYVRSGPIRALQDISQSLEFAYAKPVNGVQVLDATAAASAERRLMDVLKACVEAGADVGFGPPETAREFWKQVTADIAAGKRTLVCGWADGRLMGAAVLDLATWPSQQHRSRPDILLEHPDAHRSGLARALTAEAEQARIGPWRPAPR